MKNYSLILLLPLFFIVNSCKKFDEKTQFDITIDKEVEVPSLVGINLPFNLPTTTINTEVNEQLEIKNKKKKKIEYIELRELQLSILSPANKNFNFLKAVEVYISAENLPEILVAKEANLKNTGLNKINISPIENLDLTNYIKKDVIDLRVAITTDETIFQKVKINVANTFWVDVKVLGI